VGKRKTKVIYVMFLRDVVCQKLLKSANVIHKTSLAQFFETRCIVH